MNQYPRISIIIPTYNSEKVLTLCLRAIKNQNYPKDKIETIVVDNYGQDKTIAVARRFNAKILKLKGQPPQVCQQRNLGAHYATGDYLMFLDHDMELTRNLFKNFSLLIKKTKEKNQAWQVSEEVIASNKLLSLVRTFEKKCYLGSVVAASRIISKKKFLLTPQRYDKNLSSTNADWDMDNQLKLIGCRIGILTDHLIHHEENLSFWQYLNKKASYMGTVHIYQEKWRLKNTHIYQSIVKKQYNITYRTLGVFLEKGKWKLLARNLHCYLVFILITLITVLIFKINQLKHVFKK